ncbi:MAG: hypothetical protein ICV81_05880 [Flavisolibacter sp.]|nr:hypothetical protein [Flavisolibacter sp.]
MYSTISIPQLHQEYATWIQELNYYKEEIKKFEHYLEVLLKKNNKKEVAAQVEHFQNQFIRHKEVIDELKHNLGVAERQLKAFVLDVQGMGLPSIKMDNHPELRKEVQTFRKIYRELKEEFRKFEATCI